MFDLVTLTMLSLAVAAASITTSRSKLTESFRGSVSIRWPLIGALLGCPYCISHYYAAFGALFFSESLLTYAVVWLATIAGSSIAAGIMQRLNFLHEITVQKEKAKTKELTAMLAERDAKIAELREVLFELSANNRREELPIEEKET